MYIKTLKCTYMYGLFKKITSIHWKNWVQNPFYPMSIQWPSDVYPMAIRCGLV